VGGVVGVSSEIAIVVLCPFPLYRVSRVAKPVHNQVWEQEDYL